MVISDANYKVNSGSGQIIILIISLNSAAFLELSLFELLHEQKTSYSKAVPLDQCHTELKRTIKYGCEIDDGKSNENLWPKMSKLIEAMNILCAVFRAAGSWLQVFPVVETWIINSLRGTSVVN